MGFPGKPSILKRQKELARREKQKEKQERRANKLEKRPGDATEGEDPDIAHIVPGPQPIPDEP